MMSLTGTSCVPSGTRIFAMVPSSTASTSIVALSVSISAMMSPDLTLSPSFLSHLATLPSVIVGERAGIRMLIGILRSPRSAIADLLGGFRDLRRLRQSQLLEIGGIRHRDVDAGDPRHRRVEIVEGVFHHDGREFGTDAGHRPALFDGHQPVGLLH